MTADDSAVADTGRLLAASAMIGLAGSSGPAAAPLRRVASASPARRVAAARDAGDPLARPLARALRTTATGRLGPGERERIGRIEARRARLAAEHGATAPVFSEDPGAEEGRWRHVGEDGSLAAKCGTISIPPRWGTMLVRLVRELAPSLCVELGTGFGLSAAFAATGLELNGAGRLVTFEGAEEWAAIAREGAEELGLERIEVNVGPLSESLPRALGGLGAVDFAFVDAEHTKESTLRYFDQLLPHLSDRAVVLFDDIDFDRGMWEAWEGIRDNPRTRTWVALGRIGLVRVRT